MPEWVSCLKLPSNCWKEPPSPHTSPQCIIVKAEMAPGVEESKRQVNNSWMSLLLIPSSSFSPAPHSAFLSQSFVPISAFVLKNEAACHAQINPGLPSQIVRAL